MIYYISFLFFFFNDTATTEIYTLSLHDALPISLHTKSQRIYTVLTSHNIRLRGGPDPRILPASYGPGVSMQAVRSEEHTSELQSLAYLVCRLLLEKKKKKAILNKVTS